MGETRYEQIADHARRIAHLGSKRPGHLVNFAIAALMDLAGSAANENVRLQSCKLLIELEPVRERLAAMTLAVSRRGIGAVNGDQFEAKLKAILDGGGTQADQLIEALEAELARSKPN